MSLRAKRHLLQLLFGLTRLELERIRDLGLVSAGHTLRGLFGGSMLFSRPLFSTAKSFFWIIKPDVSACFHLLVVKNSDGGEAIAAPLSSDSTNFLLGPTTPTARMTCYLTPLPTVRSDTKLCRLLSFPVWPRNCTKDNDPSRKARKFQPRLLRDLGISSQTQK